MSNLIVQPKFSLGQILATPAALKAIEDAGQTPGFFLEKHVQGDWGEVDDEDKRRNDQALVDGSRLLSAYKTLKKERLWMITEAADDAGNRAATTATLAGRILMVLSTLKRRVSMRYQVKIRFQGHISWVEVDANHAAQAKALVQQQYGPQVTVLYCKPADK